MTDDAFSPVLQRELLEILTEQGTQNRLLHHVTRARHLPDILASEALLPANQRRCTHLHGWGNNEQLGREFVCLALKPHWGMIKQFGGEEPVILSFDPGAVFSLPGVRPCPMNSARAAACDYLTEEHEPREVLRACLADRAWRHAEVLIASPVPVGALRIIAFADLESHKRWWPAIEATTPPGTQVRISDERPPRFPSDLKSAFATRLPAAKTSVWSPSLRWK